MSPSRESRRSSGFPYERSVRIRTIPLAPNPLQLQDRSRCPLHITEIRKSHHSGLGLSQLVQRKHVMNHTASSPAKASVPYGHACANCVKAKCRCIPREGSKCERHVISA